MTDTEAPWPIGSPCPVDGCRGRIWQMARPMFGERAVGNGYLDFGVCSEGHEVSPPDIEGYSAERWNAATPD